MPAGVHIKPMFSYRSYMLDDLRAAAQAEGLSVTELLDRAVHAELNRVKRHRAQRAATAQD